MPGKGICQLGGGDIRGPDGIAGGKHLLFIPTAHKRWRLGQTPKRHRVVAGKGTPTPRLGLDPSSVPGCVSVDNPCLH